MLKELKEKLKWLDPFTYIDLFLLPKINSLDKNLQWGVFISSYLILSLLVSIVFGFSTTIVGLLGIVYIYLFFFEKEEAITLSVYLVSAFIFAFVLYNFVLAFLLGTDAPLVIVFSGSMEPVLYRGDIVILTGAASLQLAEANVDFPVKGKLISEYAVIGERINNSGVKRDASIKIGSDEFEFDENGPIVVYFSPLRNQDIIHRAVLKINAPDGEFLLTMGDNNNRLDQDCSSGGTNCIILTPVSVEDLRGKYLFHLPLIGHIKLIIFDDLPWIFNCIALSQKGSVSLDKCITTFEPTERLALARFG
tara:strand:- start:4235 stop:5155 length:921 start_codon:yes stop_codon:yes gene_type:complete